MIEGFSDAKGFNEHSKSLVCEPGTLHAQVYFTYWAVKEKQLLGHGQSNMPKTIQHVAIKTD